MQPPCESIVAPGRRQQEQDNLDSGLAAEVHYEYQFVQDSEKPKPKEPREEPAVQARTRVRRSAGRLTAAAGGSSPRHGRGARSGKTGAALACSFLNGQQTGPHLGAPCV